MRFLEVPALITEDIEVPDIVDITEPITASISGTTLTIDGDSKVSGETTITLTNDVTVSTVTTSNIRQPSIHKITIKTNGVGNFTYTPNTGVTASSVSTTTKTGSDLEILLITTNGGETYLDLDVADYVSPAANFSNVLTGFNVSELTSAYGATAKLFKPGETSPLTTENSVATGSGVNFGYTESLPGEVEYKLEVTDDLGRKSTYNLPRKWINYAMGTTSTPGFQKFALEGNEYTSTVTLPSLGSSSKARIHKTTDHGYMGINFKIQGRDDPSGAWTDIPDNPPTNVESDESAEFLAFGNYKYQRVWVKPTAQATTTVSSSNVVSLTLSNVTEDVTTKTITGTDPFHVDETSNVFVFEEPTKIGSIPYTVTVGTETYTNAVTATTEEIGSTPNTDMTAAGPNMKHTIVSSWATLNTTVQVSGDGKYIIYEDRTTAGKIQVMKGDPENGYTNYTTITYTQGIDSLVSAISYDGKYILFASWNNSSSVYEMHLNDESAGTYSKLSTTYSKLGNHRCYAPAFIPRSGNYDFVLTGSDNNATCYVRLYKHNTGTDTWTEKSLITNPTNKPTGDENRGYKSKSFTSDGKYLMFGNAGSYGGYEMYTIDWDANTAVFSGANYSNNGNVGASGAVSFDGKYVLIFHSDSNSRKIFKNNDAGDWSSATDVTTDFTFADTDNDQGHGFSFCGENSEFFVSGMNAGAIRMYSWYPKKGATLAFTNPTLSLTTSDVTISSAKLYKDDVLFHTYGTESKVALRTDQTGTYQAIVNDVYYSNRITPDFTTTRSVSAPKLEFDGSNKLTIKTQHIVTEIDDEINFDTTQGGDWIDAYTKRYIYLSTDSSGDYIYWLWDTYTGGTTYTWKGVSGRRFDAIYQIKYSPSTREWLDEGSNNPTTLTKETINGVEYIALYNSSTLTAKFVNPYITTGGTSTSSTLGLPDGTTRDLTTQSNVYIYKPGTYTANVQTSDTFAYLNNVVGTVTSTILPILKFENLGTSLASTVSGVNLVNESGYTAPTYDSTNNAIQTAASSSLLCDFSSVRTSTTSDLAVVFEAYYDEADGLTAVVTLGEYPGSFPNTDFSIDQRSNMGTSIGGLSFDQKAYLTDTSGTGTYEVTANLDAGDYINKWTKHALVHYEEDAWWYIYVDGEWKLHISSSQTTTSELQNWLSDGFPSKIRVFNYPSQYATGTYSTGTKVRNIEVYDNVSFIVSSPPSLTFDGFNKLSIENITQTSSIITYPNGSTVSTNAASDVYIKDIGEYVLEASDANTFITSNVEVGALDTVPGFTAAFHHGAFSASDYSSAYSSVADAATAGFVYSDTPAGTYTWGTLAAQVKERENPDFTANSTLHTDYSSTYGWTTNSGWEVSAKDELNSSSYPIWKAFNKKHTSNNNWLSGSAPSTSSPQWLKIKYPSQQVIKSYVIRARENTSPRFPTAWKLQGANTDISDVAHGAGTGAQTITITGGGWQSSSDFRLDHTQNSTYSRFYEKYDSGSVGSVNRGFEIRWHHDLGYNKIYVNTDNNTSDPSNVKVKPSGGSYGGLGSSKEVNAGDEVSLTNSDGSYVYAVFNITSAHLFSLDETGWTDIGTEQTQTEWVPGQNKSFDIPTNTTAYQYYRLRITGSRESASLSNSDYVAIGQWILFTETSGSTVHDKYTRYTWTPESTITADVLMVAGGGGAGHTRSGGGGAGGLLFHTGQSLSSGAKTIIVGNGGMGGGYAGTGVNQGNSGNDTSFTGLTTTAGGGAGGGEAAGRTGGSSSGAGGRNTTAATAPSPPGQGYAGGTAGTDNFNGSGGGGAGGVGQNQNSRTGGIGVDYSSVFGTTYGESGWFASGGTGSGSSDNTTGAPNGGGGGGGYYGENNPTSSTRWRGAQKHTGGGGGGCHYHLPNHNFGGPGGSGIVIIKKIGAVNPPALNFDGYNKLSIDNDGNSDTGMKNVTVSGGPWNNHTFKPDDIAQKGKFQWDLWSQPTGGSQYKLGDGHSLEYVVGYGWYILNIDGTSFGDVSPTSATAGTYVDVNGATQNFSTNYASSSGGVLTIAHTDGTMTVNEADFFEGGVIPPKVGSLESVTIKKDGAAFATTTSNTVYIREAGTYTAEVRGSGAYVTELSKVVSGDVTSNQEWKSNENQIVYASDGSANNNFGRSCAMWGSYMVVGSFEGESNTQGAIYIYKKESGTWTFKQKISGEGANDYFSGYGAVDIHEDTIIVGAYKHGTNNNTGKAYIYTRSSETWSLESSIVSDDLGTDDKFGISVSVHGDYAVVGAQLDDGPSQSGAGYIFYRDGTSWSQQQKLNPGASDENVGTHVSIYGDYVVLSGKRSGSDLRGRAHVYKRTGTSWGDHTVISNPNPASNDAFSERLSITDGYVAIGSDADDPGGTSDAGQVYVFKHSGTNDWTLEATLEASDKTSGMRFASGISMTPNVLVVGAHQEGTGGANAGATYVFERSGTTWTEVKKVVASDAAAGDRLGIYVGVNNDGLSFVSGAYGESTKGASAGAAYVYEKGPAGPNITYDGKNKLTVGGTNYADTSIVTYYSNTYNIGTAKTMYVKDDGEYVFKISGTDKYVESNVHVSSVDLAGATTKPISFDGYNKLTLISPGENAVSNVSLNGGTKQELGSATTYYIKDHGTYALEMSGSNVFALSNTVVTGDITEFPNYVNATSFYYGGGVVDNTGKLYTWGHNGYGDSGRGASDRIPTHLSSISDPVSNVWRGDPGYTMAAKTSTDKWYMWGRNTYSGVLGNTTNTGNVTTPEDVTAKVTTYFGDQTVSANKILKIVMGEHHAAALTAGGKVWSWGGDYARYSTGTGTNNNTVLVTPVQLNRSPPTSGTGYEITNTNSSTSTLKIRANGSIFTFNSQTCWYYDRLAGSNNTWYTQQLGYVPSTNTFIEASISGNPDQVYHNKTSSNVTKGSITVPPEGILLSNDPSSWNGAALFANPFTSSFDPNLTGITEIQTTFSGTAALDSSGNVWFWGGASTSMQYAYPTKLLDSSSISGIIGMATNGKSIYAWKSDGTFYTRGAGNYGQLANGADNDQYTSWQTVTTLQGKTIKKVFGGNENIFAWTDDGVYGVGRGNNHKLANGSTSNRNIWHKSNTLSALSIKEIDFGHATGLVLTTDGKGYMWGEDSSNSMANALSGHQSGAAEATSISALSLSPLLSPSLTFDNYNKLTVSNFTTTDKLWPPSDGTWSITTNTSTLSEWAISGASYGNGSYKATSSVATNGDFRAYQAFEGTEPGNTSTWQILATAGILSIELPESVLINKYALLNRNYNVSEDEDASPKDFTFEGSSDGSTWVVLDTVTGNGYYTAEGTASQQTFTISNTTAYKHYRLNVTANNGDSGTVVGELKLLVNNPRTATLTDPSGSVHTLGQTQDTIYIKDTGDYTLDVQNNDQKAIVLKNVSGPLSASPGTPLMTSIFLLRENGTDYTEASPNTSVNSAWDNIFVDGNTATKYLDGHQGSGIGFAIDIHFSQTFTVNTAVFKMISNYSTTKDLSFRCGASDSSYITVDPGEKNYSSTQTITFTFSSPITVNKLYFAIVQDGSSDLYSLLMTNGDIIINDIAYPLADSDKVLPSPVLNFDTYNKLTIANVDSDATSNIDFFSNTYEMGSRKELIINDEGTYHANIYSSNTLALVKKQVATVNSNPIGTYSSIFNIDGTGTKLGASHTAYPISFNAAGTRVVIGEYNTHKAHIYDKVGGSWTLSQTWTESNTFGKGCAMSDDGNVVVVVNNDKRMSLYVYENGSWVTKQNQTQISNARDTLGNGLFMSGDGLYLLVTDYSYEGSGGKGRNKIFDISEYSFLERHNHGFSNTAYSWHGDIDRYGNRAIYDDGHSDYWRVYKRSGASWSQSTTIAPSNTSGRGPASCDENMVRVALSDISNSNAGVTIWYRNPSGDTFALEQTITVDNSGCNISMNYAGDRLMITDKIAGDIEIWTRSGTTWTKQKTINPPTFGTLVNYSHTSNKGDGYTLAITDETYDSNKGRVYIYSDPPPGPSLTFDGYNKLTAPVIRIFTPPSVINFHSDGSAEDWAENGYAYHNITNTASGPQTFQLRTSSGSANGDGSQYNISIDFQKSKYVCADVGSSSPHFLMVGDGSAPSSLPTTTTVDLINPTDYLYIFQSNSNVNGYSILDIQGPDLVTTVLTKTPDSWDVGTASSIYIDATGTYDAQAKNSNTFVIKASKQVTIATKPDYTNIWAGEYGGMVVDSEGKLYTWGNDGNNQSGRGAQDRTPTHISTISDPVSNVWVEGAAGRTRIVKTSTDKWYMWGMNLDKYKIFGQTGDQTAPVDVTSDFTTYFGAQGTSDTTRIVKVVMSASACSALAADGKVWSWGVDGNRNELGKNTTNGTTATPFKNTTDGSAELSNITDIRCLLYGKLALDSNGDVWQWGTLRDGSTGYATKQTVSNSYVNISLDSGFYYPTYEYRVNPNTVQSSGYVIYNLYHLPSSTFSSSGHNIKVQLSNNTWLDANSGTHPDTVTDNGTTVSGTRSDSDKQHQNPLFVFTKPSNVITDSVNIIGIGSSFFTAYAWDAAGTIYSIGQGTEGQLGNGASSNQDSTWQTVTTLQGKTIYGIYGAGYSVFAHTSDGVYACGQGTNGRLGMGNSDDLNVFTKSTALSALSIYKMDFGHGPGYIITTDGKGYALGYDYLNSIPTPLSGDKNVPTEASSLSDLSLVYNPPAITYDNANKLSLSGVTTPSSNLTFGSVTTDIGSAKDVYIKDQGTYKFHTNDGNQALILSNEVSSTPSASYSKTVPLAFHHGTFADSGDPYSDGSVSAAASNGHVYSDTPTGTYSWGTLGTPSLTADTNTSYTWTPPSAITGADVLMVAGGGGGGRQVGGGGGAGGLLHHTNQSISGQKTIVVGDGGAGGKYSGSDNAAYSGNDTTFTGFDNAIAGGKAAGYENLSGSSGGSGGGGSGSTNGYAGTSGQGNSGGNGVSSSWSGGGGGGAGASGTSGSSNVGGAGGAGLDKSSVFGTTYGDSGWFAGGGGGASSSTNTPGARSQGGGGQGGNNASNAAGVRERGKSHTGGGGGGTRDGNTDQTTPEGVPTNDGGKGGSGIVLMILPITYIVPSQVYDNTKTITVSNIPSGTSTMGKIYKGATAYTIHATEPTSNVVIKNTGSYVSVFTTSSTAYLTNTVNVNATPTTTSDDNTIEDEALDVTTTTSVTATIAFHDGTFADSDDPHSDGSITAAATAGHVYSDTAPGTYTWGTLTSCVRTAMANNLYSNEDFAYNNGIKPTAGFTTYKWTPPGAITNGRTLVVAGGGGGGADMGGGGGAGGMLASTTTNIAHTEQTIQVGGGGARGYDPNNGNRHAGGNGADSSISGPGITAIGGGGGATEHSSNNSNPAGSGGSGGGASGARSQGNGSVHGTGISGQGHDGGSSGDHWYMGGGGGAGAVGGSGNSSGHGGDGLEDDILGTNYWWAGGGGSNTHHPSYYDGTKIRGGKGGGGSGAPCHSGHGGVTTTIDTNGITDAGAASPQSANWAYMSGGSGGKHTGGGGGGGDHVNQTRDATRGRGGLGGSGIVAIKFAMQVSTTIHGIPGSTAVASASTTADAPSTVLVATTEVAAPTLNLDFTANMSTFPRNLKRYNNITSSSIGARFNRTESKKKRVQKTINTDTFSIELTANNMGDSSSSSSTLPVTVVNSGAGTQYTSGWTTAGTTSSFVVPSDAPNALYYYSENDNTAGGSISVTSATTTTHAVTVVSSSAGTQYTSGWTASGTPGSSGATSTFVAPSNAPNTLYYYCGNHSGMGGAINMVSASPTTTFAVTVQSVSGYYGSSSNYYFIDGTQQATISLVRGKTYTFNNNASANHPMYITTSSDGTTYTSGVTNGGSSSVTFAVPLNAPSTLYYKCGVHGGMGGTINILGPTASPLAVTVAGGKFVIGGVSQATLQLVKGETYVFNQENSSNGTHPLRLSTTSNGTHVSGGSGFYIDGTQRPTLSMVRGNTYTFDQTDATNGSHVFQIATASDGTQYTSGYTAATGTFVVPLSAPDTLYYKSSTTSGMGGLINVTGSTTSAFVVTFSGGKFSIGGVEQASLSVIRGLTYTFNQISGHVLSLSSTSDGTRNTGVNKYYISGVETPTLTFIRGSTYTFTQETSTNTGHPIRLSATSNGTHASGSQYMDGWTTTPASPNYVPGVSGASSQFIVPANAPNTLYYYCGAHSGMGGASSINVADSNSGIILTYGTHALVANSTVSGEHTIATNFDGTTSNLYVNGDLISQTTPTIASGAKMLKIGEDYNGLIKNLKFWNYAKRFFLTGILESYSSFYTNLTGAYSVRLLFSNYTGDHVRIKRSSDNAEIDVKFDKVGVVISPTDWISWSGTDTLYVMKWYDQSGNNKFGTASGNPTYDKTNKRVVFDTDDYFTLPNGVAPTGDSAYSIIAYHNTLGNNTSGIFGSGNFSTNDKTLALRRNTSGYTNYWWGDDLDAGTYGANTVVSATYRASGTTRSIYTNGTADSTTTTTTRNGVAGNETIGVTNTNEYLNGELYELLVFDTGLSASTISGISSILKTY